MSDERGRDRSERVIKMGIIRQATIALISVIVLALPLGVQAGTWSGQVSASSDDAGWTYEGVMDLTGGAIGLIGGGSFGGGLRFTDVEIPQGATIISATLTVCVVGNKDKEWVPDFYISGAALDNAPTFTTTDYDFYNYPVTVADVNWDAELSSGGWNNSPDISSVVQEVVDRTGWSSGNAMVILVGSAQSDSEFRIKTYDSSPPVAAILTVTYE